MLSHYAAGNAGAGKQKESRDGPPRARNSRQGLPPERIVVITVLTVIGSYCGQVTISPPPEPAWQVTEPMARRSRTSRRRRAEQATECWHSGPQALAGPFGPGGPGCGIYLDPGRALSRVYQFSGGNCAEATGATAGDGRERWARRESPDPFVPMDGGMRRVRPAGPPGPPPRGAE